MWIPQRFFFVYLKTPGAGIRLICVLCSVKVVIIHQHFKTPQRGGAIRSYYLAKALVERGVETVVITAHNERKHRRECLEGIDVHFVPVAYENRFGFNRRLWAFFRFVLAAVKLAGAHHDADLCYTISTPLTTGLAAIMIRRRYGIPYIFEVGDLWPDAPVALGFIRNPLARILLFRVEKAIYRRADAIVALSVAIREAIGKKISGKSIHLLPNMADTTFFRQTEKDSGLEEKFGVQGKFVVSYIGAVGMANGLSYFLDCAAATQRHGLPVRFLLCGDGAMLAELKAHAKELELDNLTFIPFQNREGVRDVMNVTDASFISYLPVKILETGSPNKYFDALAAGKLAIINFGGWIKDEIEKARCGIYVESGSPEDFVTKVKPFVEDRSLLKKYQCASRKLAEAKYSRSETGSRYWELIIRETRRAKMTGK